jgi:agmatine deiminase
MTGPVPAEWAPHQAMWVGFPSHADLWGEDLQPAREEVAAFCRALAGPGGERVRLLAATDEAVEAAAGLLGADGGSISIAIEPFGDIWLRDTGPIFTSTATAAEFRFNGWGGKYELAGDGDVARRLSRLAGADRTRHGFVLEGGAIDHDGAGTAITTRQCLLNPNRNSGWTQAAAEAALGEALGVRKLIWLGAGLMNDHTDGHVDNLARFVAPGVVACPIAIGSNDPNAAAFDDAARILREAMTADGAKLEVARIASPGRIADDEGRSAPASHMNFVIANRAVIMPSYGAAGARLAIEALEMLFPDRQVIALPSRALLTGGGSFHCICQQQPA